MLAHPNSVCHSDRGNDQNPAGKAVREQLVQQRLYDDRLSHSDVGQQRRERPCHEPVNRLTLVVMQIFAQPYAVGKHRFKMLLNVKHQPSPVALDCAQSFTVRIGQTQLGTGPRATTTTPMTGSSSSPSRDLASSIDRPVVNTSSTIRAG